MDDEMVDQATYLQQLQSMILSRPPTANTVSSARYENAKTQVQHGCMRELNILVLSARWVNGTACQALRLDAFLQPPGRTLGAEYRNPC